MSVLSRITRLFKADMHGVMDQLEDKELLVKQYLREMEGSLQSKELRLQQLAEDIRINESKQTDHSKEINKLEEDLGLARSSGVGPASSHAVARTEPMGGRFAATRFQLAPPSADP